MTLARGGFEKFAKTTKRAVVLAEMDQVIPWTEHCALIEPHYPKAGGPGARSAGATPFSLLYTSGQGARLPK